MLNANGSLVTDNRSPLMQWAQEALGLPGVQVQVRLRGNHLHILCEGTQCPPVEIAVTQFSAALNGTDFGKLLPSNHPRIYQIFLCGRTLGQRRNDWTVRLHCNSLNGSAPVSKPSQPPGSSESHRTQRENRERVPVQEPDPKHQSKVGSRKSAPAVAETPSARSRPPQAVPQSQLLSDSFQISPLTIDAPPAEFRGVSTTLEPASPMAAEPEPLSYSRTVTASQPETSSETLAIAQTDVPPSWQLTADPATPATDNSALIVSNETLARQGYPDAIASFLSEILGPLGVSVRVSIRHKEQAATASESTSPSTPRLSERRLLALLESSYNPDPSLLAEPIAQRLRELKLEDFRDAIIISMVQGETKADWMMRVDLTPPDRMLKEWARWGDVQAVAELLNQQLQPVVEVRATLKESTLHLFCSQTQKPGMPRHSGVIADPHPVAPNKQEIVTAVAPLLSALAPQGIQAATLYGVTTTSAGGEEAPAWIDWLDLPAAHHPDLAPSAWTLASQGDRSALRFMINRLLNPELERKLQTGGIRVILLLKGELLHIMSEAPTCPSQSKVGPPIAQLLRQLQIPHINGVRVYGRRAGQKLPLWRYGVDFTNPSRQKASATATKSSSPGLQPVKFDQEPEFAPTTDISDLALQADLVLHPDIEPVVGRVEPSRPHLSRDSWMQRVQRSLMASGLFVPREEVTTGEARWCYQTAGVGLVWATLGCLFAWQVDLLASQLLQPVASGEAVAECQGPGCQKLSAIGTPLPAAKGTSAPIPPSATPSPNSSDSSTLPLPPTAAFDGEGAFNHSGFTKPGSANVTWVANCGPGESLQGESCELNSAPTFPSFHSQQLDEQLIRYQHYLQTEKKVPDILIVGSSRALRGIDPKVLEQALAKQGYRGLKIYNFGVNGATIQVVDLIVRRILPPEQLPKLIVLADGARAVNSGRIDVTYNAIANSEGYQQLALGTFHRRQPGRASFQIRTNQLGEGLPPKSTANPLAVATHLLWQWSASEQAAEQWTEQKLSELSGAYRQRDRLTALLRSLVATQPLAPSDKATPHNDPSTSAKKIADNGQLAADSSEFNPNGFLPISLRFDPITYYQKHPKVSGDYDSDYQNFQLDGTQTTAIKKLVDFTQERNINLVFVNMPLTQDYLDPVRANYEQEFRRQMQQLADEIKFTFLDISQLWPEAREYFSDPSHLNRYGAVAVSKHLAQDSTIPWPKTP